MNYKKVITDYNNGTIDPTLWKLVIDNDGGYWEYLGDNDIHNDRYDMVIIAAMDDKYGSPEGYSDTVDILQAAGVNAEWC